MTVRNRWVLAAVGACALYFLYFFGLTRVGMLGPDEPRYAAIGREMAQSGDWITPRLWGHPWFEKPALLYWMTAGAFKAGFGLDLAPRLPVALASVAFLAYFFIILRREFGDPAAFLATTILATSAGWLAFSHVAVTDLPMSAAFGAAMLCVMRGKSAPVAGVFLGLAVLAKGLLPLALFLPAFWFWRNRLKDLAILFAVATLVAAPWYVLVTARNGMPFIDEFFWKQHFARYLTAALQHSQPFWFFVPVLLAGLFPWTPLLPFAFSKRLYEDARAVFLLAWFAWGFVFVSGARNKLPGYLLPVLPAAATLMGIAIAEIRTASWKILLALAACAYLLWFIPAIANMLPQGLLKGVTHATFAVPSIWTLPVVIGIILVLMLERAGQRQTGFSAIALGVTLAVGWMVWRTYPELDRQVSPRVEWSTHSGSMDCIPKANRSWRYGLDYYAGRELPDCN